MVLNASQLSAEDYGPTLAHYLAAHDEGALYRAGVLSQRFIESGLGPEDIIALHSESLERALDGMSYREQVRASADAHQFLLEVMIAYGVKYKEYLELKLSETLRDAESRALRDRQRAQEAERLQREKGEILGVIAHELRSPLTVAKGTIDLAERSLARGEVEPLSHLLVSAREALERLSRLSGDLVEASRGEVPRLECSPVEIVGILRQSCTWAQPAAQSKGIAIALEDPPEEPTLVVMGNADALLSIYGNLLSNAIRYTPANGRVTVRYRSEDNTVWTEVADSGIGMPPEVLERIFERFYRAPDARRAEPQGLGLGLALVHQMVEAQKGHIEVDSLPGEGSRFRVVLPRADA